GLETSQSRGVLLFSASAATSDLSGKDDLFFRTVASTDAMGAGVGQYVRQRRELSSIAIIYDEDNDTYSLPMKDAFIGTFTDLGGQITTQVGFPGGEELDYSDFVEELIASSPEGIFIIANPLDTALIAQTVRIKGSTTALFCTPWCQANSMLQNGGSAIEGVELIIANDANVSNPASEAFKIDYQERFALSPIFIAMQGYETMQMLAQALEKTAGEPEGLPEALKDIKSFQGLSGEIEVDAYGDAVRSLVIQRVIDGQFVTVESLALSR
ncbi:MAG: ABC transporter substrate-binding protein, partial [Pseudomonadota bacterium]|nr:ABC transporter substrate-binding protein [Pseudomonadota bacterium]